MKNDSIEYFLSLIEKYKSLFPHQENVRISSIPHDYMNILKDITPMEFILYRGWMDSEDICLSLMAREKCSSSNINIMFYNISSRNVISHSIYDTQKIMEMFQELMDDGHYIKNIWEWIQGEIHRLDEKRNNAFFHLNQFLLCMNIFFSEDIDMKKMKKLSSLTSHLEREYFKLSVEIPYMELEMDEEVEGYENIHK